MVIKTIKKIKKAVERVHIDEELKEYIVELIFATREPSKTLKNYIDFGASPRASIALYKASKLMHFYKKETMLPL